MARHLASRLYLANMTGREVRSHMQHAIVRLLSLVALLLSAHPDRGLAQTRAPATRRDGAPKSSGELPRSCLLQQHPSEQITALLETVRDHPTAGAYNTLGALYARDSRVACAVSAFEAALRLDSENWQARYNLGLALVTKGDLARAAKELQAAIRYKPDSVALHVALATLLQNQGKLDGANATCKATESGLYRMAACNS